VHAYQTRPISETMAKLDRLADFFSRGDGRVTEGDLPALREAFDAVIPMLQDVRGALSEDSVAAAHAAQMGGPERC